MTTAVCGGSVTNAKMESAREQIQCTSRIHFNGWKNEKNRYNCLKKYNFFNYLNQKEFYDAGQPVYCIYVAIGQKASTVANIAKTLEEISK